MIISLAAQRKCDKWTTLEVRMREATQKASLFKEYARASKHSKGHVAWQVALIMWPLTMRTMNMCPFSTKNSNCSNNKILIFSCLELSRTRLQELEGIVGCSLPPSVTPVLCLSCIIVCPSNIIVRPF